jgi:hypothetical protein
MKPVRLIICVAGWALGVFLLGRTGGRASDCGVEAEGNTSPGIRGLELYVACGNGGGACSISLTFCTLGSDSCVAALGLPMMFSRMSLFMSWRRIISEDEAKRWEICKPLCGRSVLSPSCVGVDVPWSRRTLWSTQGDITANKRDAIVDQLRYLERKRGNAVSWPNSVKMMSSVVFEARICHKVSYEGARFY